MTSLLRSSKFVRYFAGFTRSLIFNPPRCESDTSLVQHTHCLTTSFTKSLATQTASSQSSHESSLDRSLRRLDHDVRRSGRISRRELDDILEELRHSRSATSTQSLLIIRCCGNLVPEEPPDVRTQLVQEIWKTLENLGVPMDVSHYNALLRVYLENEHRFSPTEFLANLEQKGVEPNRVTYQRLIARYCQDGDIEGATRILEFMREKALPVNEGVFNSLIVGHSQADDMESAAGIIQVMRQAGLEPSADTYATLLNAYAKRGDMHAINALLEECDDKDIVILDKDLMDIIYTLCVNDHVKHVDQILSRMRQMAGYNNDAVNVIYRLVNAGHEDLAMKILLTMPRAVKSNGQVSPTGSFLVRQLVRANIPVEKIVAICQQMERDGLNSRALLVATEASLLLGNVEQGIVLLSAMKEGGYPIRHHYFWPLLAAFGKRGDKSGLLDVLKTMNSQFDLAVGGETLRDYVVPFLIESMEDNSADVVINDLRSTGVSTAAATAAVVLRLLSSNKLAYAAKVASRYTATYTLPATRGPLIQAYLHTLDTPAYVSMVHHIYNGANRQAESVRSAGDEENQFPIVDCNEIIGQLLIDVVNNFRNNKAEVIQEVLEGLVDRGMSISNTAAECLQEKLSSELTSEISNLLSKLTSGELVPQTPTRRAVRRQERSEDVLKAQISSLGTKGEAANNAKKQLLAIYCRNRDLQKAEQLVKEMELEGIIFNSGMNAQLIDLYTHHEKIEEAMNLLYKSQAIDPDFTLDDMKTLRLANLLISKDKFQDGIKLLKEQPGDRKLEERSFTYNALCWRLLNSLAEKGLASEVKEMFNALVDQQFAEVNSALMGPLIKVHLVKDDLPSALAQFAECCLEYKVAPWKYELSCKLIEAEDAVALQRLTDLNSQVHGEMNSLYDLVFAFVECGRIRQARKILETPGLRSRPHKINFACNRYSQGGLVAPLEGLVEATRDLSYIDRRFLFQKLLLSYCKAKDVDKAVGLWTRMQEEDVQPTDEFLTTLGKFLQREGRDVPFVMPQSLAPRSDPAKEPEQLSPATEPKQPLSTDDPVEKLKRAMKENNYQQALEIKQRLPPEVANGLSVTLISNLIVRLVKENQLSDASKLILELLAANSFPLPRMFAFALNQLSKAGDVDSLLAIGKHLDDQKKKLLSYDNRLCHAYAVSGRSSQYLDILEKEANNITNENSEAIATKFPRGGAIAILSEQPELCERFERIARKYAEHGIITPANVLWQHLLVTGQDAAAEKLWGEYLEQEPRIMFKYITQTARKGNDVDLAHKMTSVLRKAKVTEAALGNAYSCLLDVLVNTGRIEEGLKTLETAVKDVSLTSFNRSALNKLKAAAEAEGKTFPYEITRDRSPSTSSSSSDDESKPVTAQKL